MSAQAYPLFWPEGWPRTADGERRSGSQFKTTFDRARRDLHDELRKLGADNIVVSSWLAVRQDGHPYADQARRRIPDPGVAVYFTLRDKQMVMARDAYQNVHDNLRSIGLAIEHLRGLERHGGGAMTERAFSGFAALPDPHTRDPWIILGISSAQVELQTLGRATEIIETAYRNKARILHPDAPGGSHAEFVKLGEAREAALRKVGA